MKWWIAGVLVGAFVMFGCVQVCEGAVRVRALSEQRARVYQPVELRVDVEGAWVNPYDPDEVALDAVITEPDGRTYRLPAFWYQVISRREGEELRFDYGESFWMVRFCPRASGRHAVVIEVSAGEAKRRSEAIVVEAAPADEAHGFIRLGTSERYYELDTGQAWPLVGSNLASGRKARWLDQYEPWLDALAAAGGNFTRYFMSERSWEIERGDTGLNRYDPVAARYFDELLAATGERRVRAMLALVNHRHLIERDMWGEADWPKSPYNAANGGPAETPEAFFTDEQSRRIFKKRLRYLVARYAAYPGLGWWELVNEQEHAKAGVHVEWNREMSDYLASLDPYGRPVTTSSTVLPAAVWELPNIGFPQIHLYGEDTRIDLTTPLVEAVRRYRVHGKPVLVGEFGISFLRSDVRFDPEGRGTALHNSLWSSLMAGAAGGAAHWWWDNYIDSLNVWGVYAPFARFVREVDWRAAQFEPLMQIAVERQLEAGREWAEAVVYPTIEWRKAHGRPVKVLSNGPTDRGLSKFLFGDRKERLKSETTLLLEMPADGELVLHLSGVSDFGVVQVSVDGAVAKEVRFDARPGSEHVTETKLDEAVNWYIAVVEAEVRVPLAAGARTVGLETVTGDWVSLRAITIRNYLPAASAHLNAIGMVDKARGEAMLWLYDERSNWRVDQEKLPPERLEGVRVRIPAPAAACVAEWWDTRKGEVVARDEVKAEADELTLVAPAFERDIAVRVRPTGGDAR